MFATAPESSIGEDVPVRASADSNSPGPFATAVTAVTARQQGVSPCESAPEDESGAANADASTIVHCHLWHA